MTTEKEIRDQAEQQVKEYMQKVKQQNQDKELSEDDLEKVAGGESYFKLFSMYMDYTLNLYLSYGDGQNPMSFLEWMQANGYSISW